MSGIPGGTATIAYVLAGALLLTVATINQGHVNTFIKQQTLDIQSNRIENGIMAMSSVPEGHIEIPLEGYNFHYNSGDFTLSYKDEEIERTITNDIFSGDYRWRYDESQEIEETLCLLKKPGSGSSEPYIEFISEGGCP